MEMEMWDIRSGQGRNALFYLNSSRTAVGAYLCLVSGHYCRLNVATAEWGLFWLRLPTFMTENPIQLSILARQCKHMQLHPAWIMPRCPGSHNIGLSITDELFDEESQAA